MAIMCIMNGLYFRYDTVPSLREGILMGSPIDCLLLYHSSDRNGEGRKAREVGRGEGEE